ncbi:MAG TPA: anti-sigma factor antagonist [Flavobacteriales bacterium]|nr:anti-sigma factor antagonist [Flavobacteriales bacterium]HIO67689.1 anti-sigma factor antagonist [Flavobacteriales bacterium]
MLKAYVSYLDVSHSAIVSKKNLSLCYHLTLIQTQVNFEYHIESKEAYTLINLSGILIAPNQSGELIEEFEETIAEGTLNVIVDLSGIETMNSTGLSVLISILTKARNAGGEAVLANLPEKVNELMVITKLYTVFTVAESIEAAEELLNKEETWL